MDNKFFDSCLARFIGRHFKEEEKKITNDESLLFPDYCYFSDDSAYLNNYCRPMICLAGDFKKTLRLINYKDDMYGTSPGYAFIYLPWWMEEIRKDKDRHRLVHKKNINFFDSEIITLNGYLISFIQDKNKFYPIIRGNYSKSEKNNIKIGKEKYFYEEKILNTLEKIRKAGKGSISIKSSSKTYTHQTGVKEVKYNTGNYIISKTDIFNPNSSYKVSAEQKTKGVAQYSSYTETQEYRDIEQYSYFEAVNEKEKERFIKVVENQNKIIELADEYSHLGLFDGKRKKEIMKEIESFYEYSILVLGKACVDRYKNFHQIDEKDLEECINICIKQISELENELKNMTSITLNKKEKKKRIKTKLPNWKQALQNFNKIKIIMNERIKKLYLFIDELDERIEKIQ